MTLSSPEAAQCAARVLEIIPQIMRAIGSNTHQRHGSDLTMPQFCALMIVKRHAGTSLSEVANHLGSTLSAMSRLIDGLVERQLLTREIPPEDRRRIMLAITPQGEAILEAILRDSLLFLAEKFSLLTED